jgi:hypothetical protein
VFQCAHQLSYSHQFSVLVQKHFLLCCIKPLGKKVNNQMPLPSAVTDHDSHKKLASRYPHITEGTKAGVCVYNWPSTPYWQCLMVVLLTVLHTHSSLMTALLKVLYTHSLFERSITDCVIQILSLEKGKNLKHSLHNYNM